MTTSNLPSLNEIISSTTNKNENAKDEALLSEKITDNSQKKISPTVLDTITDSTLRTEESKQNQNTQTSEVSQTKKDDNDNSNFFQLNNIKCKTHGTAYLCIDKATFELICSKCHEENKTSDFDFIASEEPKKIPKENSDEFECSIHPKSKGSFYCDTCKIFICKFCLCDEHRHHRSHLPRVIAKEFTDYLAYSKGSVNTLKPLLEDSLEEVKQIYTRLSAQKDDTLKYPEGTIQNITAKNTSQIEKFENKLITKLNGLDKEINDDFQRHLKVKERANKYIADFEEYNKKLNNNEHNETCIDICRYHKQNKDVFKEISNFIGNSLNFLNVKLENTMKECEKHKQKLVIDMSLINKSLVSYENSSVSAILTGQASNSFLLRRFIRFIHSDIKYFKATSLIVSAGNPVFITGLSLCGLYISNKKSNDPNFIAQTKEGVYMEIMITISEVSDGDTKGDTIFSEKSALKGIIERSDPVYTINFSKGIKFAKEKKYLITVENLSDASYSDLWVGSTQKEMRDNSQIVQCHNTQTTFTFTKTHGIQTDFDEFTTGIIEGILFSKN